MARVIAEDFAPEENYEDGVVENTVVVNYKDDTELERFKNENSRLRLKNQRYGWNTVLRIVFSIVYTWLLIVWLNKVIHILTHNNLCGYKLSDNVLIALLVTSTANVIGMVVIVLKNLFPEKNKDKKNQTTSDK
ncbi:MAG: hypothetical protein O9282_07965 [Flavobacterium sp.]|jgi:hypothetical protein|uniref:hypothetical protein n=1 Tax=Flavobacterium sp. TaxID=239 RepID=UPI0022C9813A|nr:hypothetical protein [Flavobacterium sp.]MCZ8298285.1 hypothetical protein [Flavobacterium sp.]MCZ8331231.1 hypothetical protein [Flavobacterium sp.]